MGYEAEKALGGLLGSAVPPKAANTVPTPIETAHNTLSNASSLAADVRNMADILCGTAPEKAQGNGTGSLAGSPSVQTGLLDTLQEHAFAVDRAIEAAYDALQRIRSRLP